MILIIILMWAGGILSSVQKLHAGQNQSALDEGRRDMDNTQCGTDLVPRGQSVESGHVGLVLIVSMNCGFT